MPYALCIILHMAMLMACESSLLLRVTLVRSVHNEITQYFPTDQTELVRLIEGEKKPR